MWSESRAAKAATRIWPPARAARWMRASASFTSASESSSVPRVLVQPGLGLFALLAGRLAAGEAVERSVAELDRGRSIAGTPADLGQREPGVGDHVRGRLGPLVHGDRLLERFAGLGVATERDQILADQGERIGQLRVVLAEQLA